MCLLIGITNLAAIKAFLVGIPEAIELFLFGAGLVVAVVMLRWLLNRNAGEKSDEKFSEKGLTNN